MPNEYRDIEASILRFASDFAAEAGVLGNPLEVVNLDAHANPQSWPKTDFFGPSELRVDFGDKEIEVYVAFAISTIDDENLHRMSKLVNRLVNHLAPPTKLPLRDSMTGLPRGYMITTPTLRVGEVISTDTQPVRPVFVRFVVNQQLVPSG